MNTKVIEFDREAILQNTKELQSMFNSVCQRIYYDEDTGELEVRGLSRIFFTRIVVNNAETCFIHLTRERDLFRATGFAFVYDWADDKNDAGDTLHLSLLCSEAGSGIGSSILMHVEEYAKEKGYRLVNLNPIEEARKFYTRSQYIPYEDACTRTTKSDEMLSKCINAPLQRKSKINKLVASSPVVFSPGKPRKRIGQRTPPRYYKKLPTKFNISASDSDTSISPKKGGKHTYITSP